MSFNATIKIETHENVRTDHNFEETFYNARRFNERLITSSYQETINNVREHLREKHPDHLMLIQEKAEDGKSPKPYYWCSRSYGFLLENIIRPVPIAEAMLLTTAKAVAMQMNKPVIIIDNTITESPYYQIIHPLKHD